MKIKALAAIALTSLAAIGAGVGIASTTSGTEVLAGNQEEKTYTIAMTVQKFNAKDNTFRTDSDEYNIQTEGFNKDFVFKAGDVIANVSALRGMKAISIVDDYKDNGEPAYQFTWGYNKTLGSDSTRTYVSSFKSSFDEDRVDLDSSNCERPTYFRLQFLKDVKLTSINVEYSCVESQMPERFIDPVGNIKLEGKSIDTNWDWVPFENVSYELNPYANNRDGNAELMTAKRYFKQYDEFLFVKDGTLLKYEQLTNKDDAYVVNKDTNIQIIKPGYYVFYISFVNKTVGFTYSE